MPHDLLDDDIDWDNDDDFEVNTEGSSIEPKPVVTLQTFSNEEQAHVAAAALRAEGIEARVVTASTSQLTPFAYGNVRLFVAESQADEARAFLKIHDTRQQVFENPRLSAMRILLIIIVALFALAFASRFMEAIFRQF